MSAYGYELPWAGIVDAQPSPNELHALITPPELLHLTRSRLRSCGPAGALILGGTRIMHRFRDQTAGPWMPLATPPTAPDFAGPLTPATVSAAPRAPSVRSRTVTSDQFSVL